MAAATQKGDLGTPATIMQELNWQRSVGGDPTKINQWKEVMGSLQEFKAYMFVKKGSCFATAATVLSPPLPPPRFCHYRHRQCHRLHQLDAEVVRRITPADRPNGRASDNQQLRGG